MKKRRTFRVTGMIPSPMRRTEEIQATDMKSAQKKYQIIHPSADFVFVTGEIKPKLKKVLR